MKFRSFSFLLILVLFLIQLQHIQAQDIYYINKQIIEMLDNVAWLKSLESQSSDYEGSPYHNDLFIEGNIYYGINWLYPDIPMRYNIFNDVIEIKIEGKETIYAIEPDKRIKKIIIKEDTFVVADYKENGKFITGYFKVLVEGRVALLAKHQVDFKEKQPPKPYQDPEPAKFTRKNDKYYIQIYPEIAHRFSSIKKLIDFLGDHKNELMEFAKQQKISVGNEAELIQFISYYNSLDSL